MAIATIDQILIDVKNVLPIYDDTELYDDQLVMLIQSAMNKLKNEGVDNLFDYQTPSYYDYITCVRYQVASDMDLDIDIERMTAQYIARVNTLRCSLNQL